MQPQARHRLEQVRSLNPTAIDQSERGPFAARGQSIEGVIRELDVTPARYRQLSRAGVQALAHQRGRWRDASAAMQAVSVQQVQRERRADAADKHGVACGSGGQ